MACGIRKLLEIKYYWHRERAESVKTAPYWRILPLYWPEFALYWRKFASYQVKFGLCWFWLALHGVPFRFHWGWFTFHRFPFASYRVGIQLYSAGMTGCGCEIGATDLAQARMGKPTHAKFKSIN